MQEKFEKPNPTESAGLGAGASRQGLLTLVFSVLLGIGLLVYATCVFKDISYPLMWADESMTAVGAERVLQFGYPKVHDGRSVFYDLLHDDKTLGIEQHTDAYIGGAGWAQYYFAAPFAAVARLSGDLYTKTGILRVPFALCGAGGLLIMLLLAAKGLPSRLYRLGLAALFIFLEIPSVTFMLHLREVRYYSLQLLITATALAVFAGYQLFRSLSYRTYLILLLGLVPLLFVTFSPSCLAFVITVFLYAGADWLLFREGEAAGGGGLPAPVRTALPVFAALLLVVPLVIFFRTLEISSKLAQYYEYSSAVFLEHLSVVWGYFTRYDVMAFAVVAKVAVFLLWRRVKDDPSLKRTFQVSLLYSVYFVVHALLVCKIPNRLYVRYFITLQPVLVLTFALDCLILLRVSLQAGAARRALATGAASLLLASSACWSYVGNGQMIGGRLYELTHRYYGVLDFVIPYLAEHYPHPDRLLVATNYEEMSYVYYLGCRTIGGFVATNPQQELSERPDCVIFRTYWEKASDKRFYDYFLARDRYQMLRFPVYDYGFNNTPEAAHWTPATGWQQPLHQFKTLMTEVPEWQATIYLREDAAGQR